MSETLLTLLILRRVMDRIHAGGSIWYDENRYRAYALVARIASDLRHERAGKGGLM